MSLRINQTIETRDGFIVPSGTIVQFTSIFPKNTYEAHMNMFFYKNQNTIDDGGSNYYPANLTNLGYVKNYPINEFTGLTPTQIHVDLKSYLETVYTGGTIDIII
jgi:hypothetical protein